MLKGFLLSLVFLIPLPIGFVFHKRNTTITCGSMLRSYLYGHFLMWAVFQVLTVPMILLKASFVSLVITFSVLMLGAASFGIYQFVKCPKKFSILLPKSPLIWLLFLMTIVLIVYQAMKYITGIHIDQDDARYIAEANDAIYYNRMLLSQPETGEFTGDFSKVPIRDIYSPWPIYLATLSWLTTTMPAALAHTYYAPLLLLLSYLTYACVGSKLFKGTSERVIFLFLVMVIHLYFAGPAINEGAPPVHTLTRIWQGKGVVEAIAIPAIIFQMLVIQEDNCRKNWILLTMICCGSCLFTGLGITLSLILIGIYGVYVVCCKRFKSIPWLLLALTPAALFQVIYYFKAY